MEFFTDRFEAAVGFVAAVVGVHIPHMFFHVVIESAIVVFYAEKASFHSPLLKTSCNKIFRKQTPSMTDRTALYIPTDTRTEFYALLIEFLACNIERVKFNPLYIGHENQPGNALF